MLEDDLRSLKACSLTCKIMFISARRIIHRKIYLTWKNNWGLLTVPERERCLRGEEQEFVFRVLPTFAGHGLLPYARHLFIHVNNNFTPANLQPFNHHFQCFNQIQELNVHWFDTPGFLENFDNFFANFVPTLRSLHLDTPAGDTRDILDFICRFPHLDDLTFKSTSASPSYRNLGTFPVVDTTPPFRGSLKLSGITERSRGLLQQLVSLPGECHFRSIALRNCEPAAEQLIVNTCRGTLESISITRGTHGECRSIL